MLDVHRLNIGNGFKTIDNHDRCLRFVPGENRESRENRERARRCDRGPFFFDAASESDKGRKKRGEPESQKTCLDMQGL